ncbi:MAG: hypothetical protein ACXAC7_10410 [Candidatus Hodarchaeales archaeon]|jgi:hypothetical protein
MSIKLCGKCSRPIYIGKGPYCPDCAQQLGTYYPRCSFCGKNKQASPLHYNQKRDHIYCTTCLQGFLNELKERGFEEKIIRKIIREDFIPIR